jgi:hypothetical protein
MLDSRLFLCYVTCRLNSSPRAGRSHQGVCSRVIPNRYGASAIRGSGFAAGPAAEREPLSRHCVRPWVTASTGESSGVRSPR